MKKQIQIIEIENGYLVKYVDAGKLKMAMMNQQQVVPSQHFCKTIDEIYRVLREQLADESSFE